jgi:hypothetical protein
LREVRVKVSSKRVASAMVACWVGVCWRCGSGARVLVGESW